MLQNRLSADGIHWRESPEPLWEVAAPGGRLTCALGPLWKMSNPAGSRAAVPAVQEGGPP